MMRLLAATGGSGHSALALELSTQLALKLNAHVTLLTIVHHKQAEQRAQQALEERAAILRAQGVDVLTAVRIGRRGREIVRTAAEGRFDLVIIGERSRHRVRTRLMGSVVTHVTGRATCPVLIAKGRVGNLDRLLICDSGARGPSVLDLLLGGDLRQLAGSGVQTTILHVMSQIGAGPGRDAHQLRADADLLIREHTPEGKILEQDLEILKNVGISASPRVRHGLVTEEILTELETGDYDLVIIGAHRKAGWESVLLDDLARQIISRSSRPVLLLR